MPKDKNPKCHPNLTEAEEQNYDVDPAKKKEEKDECSRKEANNPHVAGKQLVPVSDEIQRIGVARFFINLDSSSEH